MFCTMVSVAVIVLLSALLVAFLTPRRHDDVDNVLQAHISQPGAEESTANTSELVYGLLQDLA